MENDRLPPFYYHTKGLAKSRLSINTTVVWENVSYWSKEATERGQPFTRLSFSSGNIAFVRHQCATLRLSLIVWQRCNQTGKQFLKPFRDVTTFIGECRGLSKERCFPQKSRKTSDLKVRVQPDPLTGSDPPTSENI